MNQNDPLKTGYGVRKWSTLHYHRTTAYVYTYSSAIGRKLVGH